MDDIAPEIDISGKKSARSGVVVVGGGPAGLIAAEVLSRAGISVTIYDRMPTFGRKLQMAGRGGLNLTHSEPLEKFLKRYGKSRAFLAPPIESFSPIMLRDWAAGLGEETFVGSSGRVFPKAMKAAPLLRAWLARLRDQGVEFRYRMEWLGWDGAGDLLFRPADGAEEKVPARAVILALGGASWPRLGSNGAWTSILEEKGVAVAPLRPANCGFKVQWSEIFRQRFQGQPLKNVALTCAGRTVRGEAMVTAQGIEGGTIYALSSLLRERIETDGQTVLQVNFCPDRSTEDLRKRLGRPRGKQSQTDFLRRALGLPPIAINLMREAAGPSLPSDPAALAELVQAAPITLTAPFSIERAISSAGGIVLTEVDGNFMLARLPGVFVAGEMLDWEAPTGGYLLQGTFASGVAAAQGLLAWLQQDGSPKSGNT
ncbi:TIGR03862 family flavoprotein [Hwanghaeella grinnelliae]|uniref:TIGR03862 family flavoprotein n=1 Tax=Hwanghaeella grinnelliae TaxID=2500179 RepID=A0A3S2VR52_9PROT|nr:TIGR03862 family flavoprotein [Hwanghaeella grinnelliae]RVU39669.1 TIGR03862 family flavoprotein [Hwanghaeella grinnelliae]